MSDLTLSSSGNIGIGNANPTTTWYISPSVPRPIKIQPVANGYTISIGCQTFVFESLANLLYRIEEYYNNPTEMEKHFQEHNALPVILPKKK